jgi:flagellar hook protein FlgE
MSNYTIGLAGLQNTSLAIDNTSNNIANAQTVGYKAGEYIFADQYFKAIDPSDVNRVGQGSQRLAVRRPLTYGTIQNSQNPLDMAIGGDGWFRVLSNPEDPSSLHYTRNGQFAIDKNGWIVNQNGMYLTGYQPTSDGTAVSDDVRGLGTINGKLRMPPDYANGVQTSVSKISAILDSRENAFTTGGGVAFDPTQNTYNAKTTQTIFDSNGTGHTLEVFYRRVSDTTLQITSKADGTGYSYSPGFNASPNTSNTQTVLIPKTSNLTVQTAAITSLLTSATGQTSVGTSTDILFNEGNKTYAASEVSAAAATATSITLTNSATALSSLVGQTLFVGSTDSGRTVTAVSGSVITLSGSAGTAITSSTDVTFKGIELKSSLAAGDKVFSNGVDTGLTLATAYASGAKVYKLDVTGSNIDIPASAAISFYKADIAGTATGSSAGTTLTLTGALSDLSNRRLFIDGNDTGLKVSSVSGTTVTLDGSLSSAVTTSNVLSFRQTLDMTLQAPDGTRIVVEGTTNIQNSGTILEAVQANIEAYASINGVFYDHTDSTSTFTSRPGTPSVSGSGGYQTTIKMGFIGGRNLDSLMVDSASGLPVFSSKAKLTTKVSAGSQQSTTIPLIYDLDLSDTQLQASSFMVNQSYQNGEPRSELSSVSIDSSGTIVGVYGNGRKIVAGQIALAQFDADEQLIPVGNNAFAPSYRSGTEGDNGVRIGRAGEGSFGEIKSMAVEASTVDLSNELVKLMILQRMYSANSQSIRAFDQTLRDTIQMTS